MPRLRIVTELGVQLDGVLYDHPALQAYREERETRLGGPRRVLVRAEVRDHVGDVAGSYCQVRTLNDRLLCLAAPVRTLNPVAAQLAQSRRLRAARNAAA